MPNVIILDRDGTINVDTGYVYKQEDWQFTPGAPEALKKLEDAGFVLAIATGQSGIGRGIYTAQDMYALHLYMQSLLTNYGVTISAIAFCPHAPEENCACRKPKLGMFETITQKLGPMEKARSFMVGDKLDDVLFGQAAGLNTVLLKSTYWNDAELNTLVKPPTHVAGSLAEAAAYILSL